MPDRENPPSGPSALSDRQVEIISRQLQRVLEASGQRGAQVSVQDPRFTQMIYWFLSAITFAILGGFSWQLSTLSDLRQQNAVLLTKLEAVQLINSAQDVRLSIYDDRLRAVEKAVR